MGTICFPEMLNKLETFAVMEMRTFKHEPFHFFFLGGGGGGRNCDSGSLCYFLYSTCGDIALLSCIYQQAPK